MRAFGLLHAEILLQDMRRPRRTPVPEATLEPLGAEHLAAWRAWARRGDATSAAADERAPGTRRLTTDPAKSAG